MSKSLAGVAYSPAGLHAAVKSCGSHYFDKDTRRFFNSRVTVVYPVPERDATYFVEKLGGGRTPVGAKFRIGVFKGCEVTILGRSKGALPGKGYPSLAQARRVAKKIADRANKAGTSPAVKKRRTVEKARNTRFLKKIAARRAAAR